MPAIVPASAVEKLTPSVLVSLPPARMSPVGPADAIPILPVTDSSVAIRLSEKPSSGSLFDTETNALPGLPTCTISLIGSSAATASR